MNVAPAINLTAEQKKALEANVRNRSTPHKVFVRSRIILLSSQGKPIKDIAADVGVSVPAVRRCRIRFMESGLETLAKGATKPGRKAKLPEEKVKEIVHVTMNSTPKDATQWSVRTMAKEFGVSPASVQRIWSAHNLKPHGGETFKFSNDPQFIEKLEDVVGLYINPPDSAIVLSMDEKSQIQALDRTQLQLPVRPGIRARQTHDYKRNGTTTLFAALNILSGEVTGRCFPRHRHQEFLKFMKEIDGNVPKDLDVHVVMDNYATHKHANVQKWLSKHPRFHFHFTPTSSSWLNLVERWFGKITDKQIRRGTFQNVPELIQAIERYVADNNREPKPFVWTASADKIREKIAKLKEIYGAPYTQLLNRTKC
ncbi:MAG: IS630 family transposase [Bryobacteraceae bacterium]